MFLKQILHNFVLKSLNEEEVNFKLELVGVPDKKILIAFRKTMPWETKPRTKPKLVCTKSEWWINERCPVSESDETRP